MGRPGGDYWASVGRLLLVSGLWSTQGVSVRAVSTADPLEINAGRSGVLAAALVAWLCWRRGLGWLRPAELVPLLVVPPCFAAGSTLYIFALSDTTVANAVCLGSTTPIWAALMAPWAVGERTPPRVWLAATVALAGVWLATLGGGGGLRPSLRAGDLAALANAALFAVQIVALRRYHRVDLLPAFALGAASACVVCLALAGGFSASPADATLIAGMGLLHLGLPLALLARGARDVPAVQLTLIPMTEVLLSPAWAWLLLGERPPATSVLGGAVIVGAVAFAALSPPPRAKPAPASPGTR